MRKLFVLIIGLLLVSGLAFTTLGEENSVDATWSVEDTEMGFTLSATSVELYTEDDTEDGDFLKNMGAHAITVDSNADWTIKVKENDGTIEYSGDGNPNKPAGDFEFSKYDRSGQSHNYSKDWASLSSSEKKVRSGDATGDSTEAFMMDYRVNVSDDPTGTYTAELVYTISASS